MAGPILRHYVGPAGRQLHMAEHGMGPPLLLIGETPRGWRFFEHLLPHLSSQRRALAIELPGLGQSDPIAGKLSIERMAERLVEAMDALGIESADVFGMHIGNKVAAALAARWPERMRRLVLVGQSHSFHVERNARKAALGPSFARYRGDVSRPGNQDNGALRAWLGAKLVLDATWWLGDAPLGDEGAIRSAEAKSIDFLLGWRTATPIYEAVFDFDLAGATRAIQAETLVLELQSSEEANQHGQGEHLAALIPRGRFAALAVDHLAAMERQPAAIAAQTLTFLSGD